MYREEKLVLQCKQFFKTATVRCAFYECIDVMKYDTFITFYHYYTNIYNTIEYAYIHLGMLLWSFNRRIILWPVLASNITMSTNILTSFVFKNSTAHYHHFRFMSFCCVPLLLPRLPLRLSMCVSVCVIVLITITKRKTQLFVVFDHIILMMIL